MEYLLKLPDNLWKNLKIQAAKEGISMRQIIETELTEYLKTHKDGNPQYTIDQFKDPDFIACPAFFRSFSTWDYYFKRQTPDELEKFKNQIIGIDKRLGKWL